MIYNIMLFFLNGMKEAQFTFSIYDYKIHCAVDLRIKIYRN